MPGRCDARSVEIRPADDFTNLVYHALGHLRVAGPSNLHDPRYLAWCRTELPVGTWQVVSDDSDVASTLYDRDSLASRLHAFPALHESIGSFLRSARVPVAELGASHVDDIATLQAVLQVNPALLELFRTDMALCARAYQQAFGSLVEPLLQQGCCEVSPWLDKAGELVSGLRARRVELVFALGPSGRALPGRLLVGCPASWNDLPPAWSAVVALHEHAVQACTVATGEDRDRYVRSEWAALVHVAHAMRGADDGLRDVHKVWLRTLHLGPLLADAAPLGLVSETMAHDLVGLPDERQQLLMSLEAP